MLAQEGRLLATSTAGQPGVSQRAAAGQEAVRTWERGDGERARGRKCVGLKACLEGVFPH